MSSLPPEILYEVLDYSLNLQKPPVVALITTCSVFRDICLRILYSALHFKSRAQLSLFVTTYSDPELSTPCRPRSVELDITSDESNLVFTDLYALFSRCLSGKADDVERDETGRICLDLLRLCLNSHAFDPHIEMIYTSLSLVNPRRFIWIGPDPPHHFSIAIVPQAISYLFRALSEHTNLTELKLTHINMSRVLSQNDSGLPAIPSLRSLYLGQAIFLHPFVVASLILNPSMSLEKVHLVDAYRGSIWGFRLRRSDIELYVTESLMQYPPETHKMLAPFGDTNNANLATIRKVVVCEARTERIMGGDRVEENAILI